MSNKRVVFFGNERLATGVTTSAPVLQALIAAGWEIAGLIIAQGEIGQSRTNREPEIIQTANNHHIQVFRPIKLAEIHDEIAKLGADIGVLVAYGKMVPEAIINLFPRGIVNIHPSLLPKHRGPTPIESVILNGDGETGVSLMQLSPAMDAGPIYAQSKVTLSGDESKQVLADLLLNLGKEMLIAKLSSIVDGSLKPEPQDESKAQYDALIMKTDSQLDWHKSAVELERQVRAYAGWPRSRTTINGVDVIITAGHAISGVKVPGLLWLEANQFGFYTANGIFIIDRLIPLGKKEMDSTAFLAGYKIR